MTPTSEAYAFNLLESYKDMKRMFKCVHSCGRVCFVGDV